MFGADAGSWAAAALHDGPGTLLLGTGVRVDGVHVWRQGELLDQLRGLLEKTCSGLGTGRLTHRIAVGDNMCPPTLSS